MKTMYSQIARSFDVEFLTELRRFMSGTEKKMALVAKRDEFVELVREMKDPGVRALLRRAIAEIDTELLARADLFELKKRTSVRAMRHIG